MQASQFGAHYRRAASSLHDLFEIGHAFDELANPLLRKPNTHLPGSLPQGRNSPQRPAYGLNAEQLSGSPFTRRVAPKAFLALPHPAELPAHRPLQGTICLGRPRPISATMSWRSASIAGTRPMPSEPTCSSRKSDKNVT